MNTLSLYIISILFFICLILNPSIYAATINIPAEQHTIQAGIDIAKNGDTILVDDGIYKGDGNVNLSFNGKEIIVKSQNGAEKTIIDCEEKQDTRGFIFSNAETHNAILDGFTIKNGQHKYGGGIRVTAASPTIKNCNIYDTKMGAGISVFNSDVIITNCNISGTKNSVGVGFDGQFDVMGIRLRESTPEPRIINSTISKNMLAGVSASRDVSVLIEDCKISENMGTGVYIISHCRDNTIVNCVIEKNSDSGIVCREWSDVKITDSIIRQNSGKNGGGIYCRPTAKINVLGCVIAENTASDSGGGISVISKWGIGSSIKNCTITQNSANKWGGGISFLGEADFIVSKSIIWDNESKERHDEIFVSGRSIEITSCDIKGGLEGFRQIPDGKLFIYEDNIDLDPLFVDPKNGDFSIPPNSPAAGLGAHAENREPVEEENREPVEEENRDRVEEENRKPHDVSPLGNRIVTWGEIKSK